MLSALSWEQILAASKVLLSYKGIFLFNDYPEISRLNQSVCEQLHPSGKAAPREILLSSPSPSENRLVVWVTLALKPEAAPSCHQLLPVCPPFGAALVSVLAGSEQALVKKKFFY